MLNYRAAMRKACAALFFLSRLGVGFNQIILPLNKGSTSDESQRGGIFSHNSTPPTLGGVEEAKQLITPNRPLN
jgi:hypothetical protein